MSGEVRPAEQAVQRLGSGAGRVSRAWRKLPSERRLAAAAALGLFLTLFLPWYQDTVILSATGRGSKLRLTSASITGWGAFSFVEAAVLLVAAAVLALLFLRAEGRAFHVPGGDGGVITAAGVWTCLLVVWRIFDKAGGQSNHGQYLTSTGIEWGIFIALGVAGLLVYAGSRIKLAHEPEPPLPGEGPRAVRGADQAPTRRIPAIEPTTRRAPVDEPTTRRNPVEEPPTQRIPPHQAPTELTPPDEAPTRRTPRDSAGFEFPDIQEIDFKDPPTARLRRAKPDRRSSPQPEDQLTKPSDRRLD